MGNCSYKGIATAADAENQNYIRILTDSGKIMEMEGPKFVREVLRDYPEHVVFRQGRPLSGDDILVSGELYHLKNSGETKQDGNKNRMDLIGNLRNGSGLEVLPPPEKGVWRVKLVIGTQQLVEILSEEVNTEALIEQMRMAAAANLAVSKDSKRRKSGYFNVREKFRLPESSSGSPGWSGKASRGR